MLAGLSVPDEVLVDRYYRGAIVLLRTSSFALPEAAVRILERARSSAPAVGLDDDDLEWVEMLVARGLLRRDTP